MSTDPRTIAAYDARAADYASRFGDVDAPGASLRRFAAALPPGGRVLDLGCGPGTAAAQLIAMGFTLDALDASAEMVRLARARGVPARRAGFGALDATAAFDGIWANFSLLHAPRDALPGHLAAIARALTPGGHLHIGMKLGTGEARDRLDRHYTYVTRDELVGLLVAAGFDILDEHRFEEAGLAGTIDPGIVMLARHG